jgi:16S rRNA (guanine(966)-N(2))-methyltransferase RsmD
MRVISGKYKGKILKGFDINGTRPTMDRVKESLFASIADNIPESTVLDLFAGSGSLGIEALSMGAKTCYFVDKNYIACDIIRKNTDNIQGAIIEKKDYRLFLEKINTTFDIIILDPPYKENLIAGAIKKIEERNLLKKNGLILCEYETEDFTSHYSIYKEKTYGSKKVRIYKNN